MTVVERYKLYVEDLATAFLRKSELDYYANIEIDDEMVLHVSNEKELVIIASYRFTEFELAHEDDDDREMSFNYLKKDGGIFDFISVDATAIKFGNFRNEIMLHFYRFCKLHAAEFVLQTSEFELASDNFVEQGETILITPYSRVSVFSIMVSLESQYGYSAFINKLETEYHVKRKDEPAS